MNENELDPDTQCSECDWYGCWIDCTFTVGETEFERCPDCGCEEIEEISLKTLKKFKESEFLDKKKNKTFIPSWFPENPLDKINLSITKKGKNNE